MKKVDNLRLTNPYLYMGRLSICIDDLAFHAANTALSKLDVLSRIVGQAKDGLRMWQERRDAGEPPRKPDTLDLYNRTKYNGRKTISFDIISFDKVRETLPGSALSQVRWLISSKAELTLKGDRRGSRHEEF